MKRKLKVELIIEVDARDWGLDDAEAKAWFEDKVMWTHNLVLHSNEAGDQVGTVRESSFEYIK